MLLRVVATLDVAIGSLGGRDEVELWVTAARTLGQSLLFADARQRASAQGKPLLLVFGTGWGLAPSVVESAHALLEPVRARESGGYNHLSARSACAIVMDRLFGRVCYGR